MALIVTSLPVCLHCRKEDALLHCVDCEEDFCIECSDVIHKRRTRRKHMQQPILVLAAEAGASSTNNGVGGYAHCDNCGTQAFLYCAECDSKFCLDCDAILHLNMSRASHAREELAVRDQRTRCGYCEQLVATMYCAECDQYYCEECEEVLHLRSTKREHRRRPLLGMKDSRTTKIKMHSRGTYDSNTKCMNDGVADAVVFCPSCRQSLCIECDAIIHLSEDTWSHVRQPLLALQGDDAGRQTGAKTNFDLPAASPMSTQKRRYFIGSTRKLGPVPKFGEFMKTKDIVKAHAYSQGALTAKFAKSGDFIMSGGADCKVSVWGVSDGSRRYDLEGHKGWVLACDINSSSTLALSSSRDETLRLWDLQTKLEVECIAPHGRRNALTACFSPRSSMILTGSSDTKLKLWDVCTAAQLHLLKGHKGWVTSAAFVHDESVVVSAARDRRVKLWDCRQGYACVETIEAHKKEVTTVAVSPDGQYIVTGARDELVKAWDLRTMKELMAVHAHAGEVYSVDFSPCGKWFLSAGADTVANAWSARDMSPLAQFQGHQHAIYAGDISPNSDYIATASKDGYLRTWPVGAWGDLDSPRNSLDLDAARPS